MIEQVYVHWARAFFFLLLSIDCLAHFCYILVCKTRLGVRRFYFYTLIIMQIGREMKHKHDSQNISQSIGIKAWNGFIVCTLAANTIHQRPKNRSLSSESMGFVVWPIWYKIEKKHSKISVFFTSSFYFYFKTDIKLHFFCSFFSEERWSKNVNEILYNSSSKSRQKKNFFPMINARFFMWLLFIQHFMFTHPCT